MTYGRFSDLDRDFAGVCSETPNSRKSGLDGRSYIAFWKVFLLTKTLVSAEWHKGTPRRMVLSSTWTVKFPILPLSLYYSVLILSIYLLIMRKTTRPHRTPSRCSQPPQAPRTTMVFSPCLIMVFSQMWECRVQTCWSIWGDCKI